MTLAANSWQGHTRDAKAEQLRLRELVSLAPMACAPQTIAGADVSFTRGSKTLYAGIVVCRLPGLEIIDHSGAVCEIDFPYIPGYLSFREVPVLMAAWQQLNTVPDAVMLDGHGILHPRGLGVATHFGLVAHVPTLGCAKKKLVGDHEALAHRLGASLPVSIEGKTRGYIYQSRLRARPIFISPGTGMSLEQALSITQQCLTGYRLPLPTRLAHDYVNRLRRESTVVSPR